METSNQYLETEPVGKLMARYSVPCIISLLVGALYNIVDQIFLVLMAVYLIFQNQIISMFGGTVNEETFACSQEYFFYITLGIPFYMFG